MTLTPISAFDRLRLLPARVDGSWGTGDRRARALGAGMEFADYRPYQPGDDPRHIDPQLYQRFGTLNLRQYSASQQMMVILVIDNSGSMGIEGGIKTQTAKALSAVLIQAALMGGDAVQVLALSSSGVMQSPLYSRSIDLMPALAALDNLPKAEGELPLDALEKAASAWPKEALVIMVSDFWESRNASIFQHLSQRKRELWIAQVLAPSERAPELEADGTLTLIDAENGQTTTLPAAALRAYQSALTSWTTALARSAAEVGGRHLQISEDTELLETLLEAGWVG